MSFDSAITVSNLSKCYSIYEKPHHRLYQSLLKGLKKFHREFWAVRDVTFTVNKGSTVGIVGRNGAGKSTLLQLICGTVTPTSGSIEVNGRVAALLELGAGFNPDFTGRENVYLSASLYGLSRDKIDERFSSICEFSGIEEHIDQAVKTYSSGMFVRLAFAVIAHVDADILIVDEALSVGDVFFQQKCVRFLQGFKARGGTLLFVSHDMTTVNALCESALLLRRNGEKYTVQIGNPKDIAKIYLRDIYSHRADLEDDLSEKVNFSNKIRELDFEPLDCKRYQVERPHNTHYFVTPFRQDAEFFGLGDGKITNVTFHRADGEIISEFEADEDITIVIQALVYKDMAYPSLAFLIKDERGLELMSESTDNYMRDMKICAATGEKLVAKFRMKFPPMIRGKYLINVALAEGPGDLHVQQNLVYDSILLTAVGGVLVQGKFGAPSLSVTLNVS